MRRTYGLPAMKSVKCPRCLQVSYSDEEPDGCERLCSGCITDLRAAGRDPERERGGRYLRKHRPPFAWNFFVIYVLALAGLDGLLIGLTFFFPEIFGPILLIYGLVLFAIGSMTFRWLTWGFWSWSWYHHEIDWDLAKWPAIAAAAGLVCMAASARMFL
jgi:hypothetical protein